jgi:16S rRNA (uracil1498-N3)-methyltransferase
LAEVGPVVTFEEFLSQSVNADLRLLFTVRETGSLDRIPWNDSENPARIRFLTGPEGGFSPEEEKRAARNGFTPVGFGPRTLRAETAAILAAGLLQYRFGDLGARNRARP